MKSPERKSTSAIIDNLKSQIDIFAARFKLLEQHLLMDPDPDKALSQIYETFSQNDRQAKMEAIQGVKNSLDEIKAVLIKAASLSKRKLVARFFNNFVKALEVNVRDSAMRVFEKLSDPDCTDIKALVTDIEILFREIETLYLINLSGAMASGDSTKIRSEIDEISTTVDQQRSAIARHKVLRGEAEKIFIHARLYRGPENANLVAPIIAFINNHNLIGADPDQVLTQLEEKKLIPSRFELTEKLRMEVLETLQKGEAVIKSHLKNAKTSGQDEPSVVVSREYIVSDEGKNRQPVNRTRLALASAIAATMVTLGINLGTQENRAADHPAPASLKTASALKSLDLSDSPDIPSLTSKPPKVVKPKISFNYCDNQGENCHVYLQEGTRPHGITKSGQLVVIDQNRQTFIFQQSGLEPYATAESEALVKLF